eukprot:SM000187S03909  [mRNA]  locus=s187:247248:250914:- [translate_table: standard]
MRWGLGPRLAALGAFNAAVYLAYVSIIQVCTGQHTLTQPASPITPRPGTGAAAALAPFLEQDAACADALAAWLVCKPLSGRPGVGSAADTADADAEPACMLVALEDVANRPSGGHAEGGGGSRQAAHDGRLRDLKNLRDIFGVSQRQLIEARAAAAGVAAALGRATAQAGVARAGSLPPDREYLRRRRMELAAELGELAQKEARLLNGVRSVASRLRFLRPVVIFSSSLHILSAASSLSLVPSRRQSLPQLCWELAQLQDTYVLEGNYELKLRRQERHLHRQKEIIARVAERFARHAALAAALHLERERRRVTTELARAASAELATASSTAMARLAAYERSGNDGGGGGGVGCASDEARGILENVKELLSSNGGVTAATSIPEEAARGIAGVLASSRELRAKADTALPAARSAVLAEMEDVGQRLTGALFLGGGGGHGSVSMGYPVLTPPAVAVSLAGLEDAGAALAVAVEGVVQARAIRAEALQRDGPRSELERRVFVDFFLDPARLRATLTGLRSGRPPIALLADH